MKRQIRKCVFETNSSSTHSIAIEKGEYNDNNVLHVCNDNKVHVTLGEFGWGYDEYTDPYTKLQYAVTMALETEKYNYKKVDEDDDNYYYSDFRIDGLRVKSEEDFIEKSEGYQMINDLIASTQNCDGIELDGANIGLSESGNYLLHEGYIDHQSCDCYRSLQDFLDDYNMTLEDFIFDSSKKLIIDNDNH